ncbi:MAG: 3-hydroxyacyl-ACP dehydratase FabZ [Brevinematales bacterium]|nr:3-hydroxyacyl-ACP dehydratase FabZ [Brevinematales bacterium]
MSEVQKEYDIVEIMKYIPHRFPFLLVDRVTEINENGGKGYKNVTMNEWFFQGHFPGRPIYPGVLIVEGMAQCAGFIALKILEAKNPESANKENLMYFMMIDKTKFRKMVLPGDKLEYEISIIKLSGKIAKFQGYARVNGELCAEAEMTAMIDERK